MRPHVSLIIPVHNAEPFLDRCLASAAAQTEPSLEIICINDASADASGKMLDAYAGADSRFRVVHRAVNGGESVARNQGVTIARGEYLAFLDHDDMLEPDACRLLYKTAKEHDADIVKGRVKTVGYDGEASLSPLQLHENIRLVSRLYFHSSWWSAVYRASMIQGKLSFVETWPLGADMLFLTEAVLAASRIFCVDDLVYTHFRRLNSGDSLLLSQEKICSTIASRLRIIEILHDAHIDAFDKAGYLYKIHQCFYMGVDMLINRCTNLESRKLCCDYLYTVKNLHRYPELFIEYLRQAFFLLYPFFVENDQSLLQNIIIKYYDLHSAAFTAALLRGRRALLGKCIQK